MDMNEQMKQVFNTLKEVAPQTAEVMWMFFTEFKKQGFTDEQSMTLLQMVKFN